MRAGDENKTTAAWAEKAKRLLPPEALRRSTTPIPRGRAAKKAAAAAAETDYPEGVVRPQTRGDCAGGERPCPFVSCKHHLYLEVTPAGSIKVNFADVEPWEMTETCALDVADRGGLKLDEVGALLNVTRERIRQIEVRALDRAVVMDRRHRLGLAEEARDAKLNPFLKPRDDDDPPAPIEEDDDGE